MSRIYVSVGKTHQDVVLSTSKFSECVITELPSLKLAFSGFWRSGHLAVILGFMILADKRCLLPGLSSKIINLG